MMNRKDRCKKICLQAMSLIIVTSSIGLLAGCGAEQGSGEVVSSNNHYQQTNLVASSAAYKPLIVEPKLIDAWGIAIRPAGLGGHFWVTGMGKSFEYVGDVKGKPLFQDSLKDIALPPAIDANGVLQEGASNGVVFNEGNGFVISQDIYNNGISNRISNAAKFIFVSDNGVISAWTEQKNSDGTISRPDHAVAVFDEGAEGSAFFGVAMLPDFKSILAVDFGVNPQPRLRLFDDKFIEQPLNGRFANPFIKGEFKVGDLVPFNAQTIDLGGKKSIFVTYVNTLEDPEHKGQLVAATESAGRGRGRLVEYTPEGQLIAIWDDRGVLNAPWGIAKAPQNFGSFSNQLLVTNFSDGTIVGFDIKSKKVTEYLRDEKGNIIKIAGLWNILFGNGESLGDSNALYFAAGPADETEGLFGVLRYAP